MSLKFAFDMLLPTMISCNGWDIARLVLPGSSASPLQPMAISKSLAAVLNVLQDFADAMQRDCDGETLAAIG